MYHKVKTLVVNFKDTVECIGFSIKLIWDISKVYLIIRTCLMGILAVFPIFIAWIFKEVLNILIAIATGEKIVFQQVILFISFYIGAELGQIVIKFINQYCLITEEDKFNRYVDNLMVSKLRELDLHFFEDVGLNDRINNISNNRKVVKQVCERSFCIMQQIMTVVTSFIILLEFNWHIAVAIILLSIPSFIYQSKFSELFYWKTINESNNFRRRTYFKELLTGRNSAYDMRLYKEFYPHILTAYQESWNMWIKERNQMFKKSIYHTIAFDILFNFCTIATFIVGISKYFLGQILIGDIQYYVNLTIQNSKNTSDIFLNIVNMNININAVRDFQDFLGWESKQKNEGKIDPHSLETIEFRNVYFKYPDTEEYILKNASFIINVSDKTSLVGLNGCGKTTIIKLLLGFYDPTEGIILVNGQDIRAYDIDKYRERFGVLFQDYVPYNMSIKENIIISDLKNRDNEEKLKQAIRLSGLESVINTFKKGMDTQVGTMFEEDGIELSGGQLQKVAVTRAYFRESDLVILDEPSAALDAIAEHHIFNYFIELSKNRGAVLISHRLSNVIDSDKILFIKNGAVIEEGTHIRLMKKAGEYAKLFTLQAEKYK